MKEQLPQLSIRFAASFSLIIINLYQTNLIIKNIICGLDMKVVITNLYLNKYTEVVDRVYLHIFGHGRF